MPPYMWSFSVEFGSPGKRSRPAETGMPSMATSAPCTAWLPGGPRKVGKSTELGERYAYSGYRSLIGRTRSPPSSGAPSTRLRRTNERGASGLGPCVTPPPTSRLPSRWVGSYTGRAVSTAAPRDSLGAWGEVGFGLGGNPTNPAVTQTQSRANVRESRTLRVSSLAASQPGEIPGQQGAAGRHPMRLVRPPFSAFPHRRAVGAPRKACSVV
jgi:hypothetical protein